jgi:hypothetical protein
MPYERSGQEYRPEYNRNLEDQYNYDYERRHFRSREPMERSYGARFASGRRAIYPDWRDYTYNPEGNYWQPDWRRYGPETPLQSSPRGYDFDEFGWEGYYGEPTWSGYNRSRRGDWQRSGPYVGRGPQGYQRSDEQICEEVCYRLTQHGLIDASEIEVEVSQAEVTLHGQVDSRRTKRMAEDVAASVGGVKDVHNRLHWSALSKQNHQQKQESGMPGGGQGRVDEVGRSGVYPASGPHPSGNAELRDMASWGQGERGAAGYEDSGTSEVWYTDQERKEMQEKKD